MNFLKAISAWSDQAYWHSWLIHSALAVPIALLIGGFPNLVFWAIREGEQYAHGKMLGHVRPAYDYWMDVACPFLVGLLWEIVVGWNFATWWFA